jgi:hypothetical protein
VTKLILKVLLGLFFVGAGINHFLRTGFYTGRRASGSHAMTTL